MWHPVALYPQTSVIPACFYPSICLGTVRLSNRRESRQTLTGAPIKMFGGDNPGIIIITTYFYRVAAERFICLLVETVIAKYAETGCSCRLRRCKLSFR